VHVCENSAKKNGLSNNKQMMVIFQHINLFPVFYQIKGRAKPQKKGPLLFRAKNL
jgi:hypothetical protein